MKKNNFYWLSVFVTSLFIGSTVTAQGLWKSHEATPINQTTNQLVTSQNEVGGIYLGWASPYVQFYQGDGLSPEQDCRAGAAIKLPKEKFKNYIGGNLIGFYAGWGTDKMPGEYEMFVRESLNGKNLATGKAKVEYGWNSIMLDKPLELPDVDTLVLGFYANLKKGVCSIPRLNPKNQPMTCYLWQDTDVDSEGNKMWIDGSEILGTLPLLGLVQDDKGTFKDMVEITSSNFDRMVYRDSTASASIVIKNVGSTPVSSISVTSEFEGKTWSMDIPFERPIPSSGETKTFLPYRTLGSGNNSYKISKVNGVDNKIAQTIDVNLVTIPKETADKYQARHLIEFFTSENTVYSVRYYEEYMRTYLEKFKDQLVFVSQHTDDQFMLGEEDDAIKMMLDFVNNDSLSVYLPSMGINRSWYVSNPAHMAPGPLFPVFFPEYGQMIMEELVKTPTFASINVDAQWTDNDKKIKINVSGDVAENVMPKDEPLYLTVYVVEYNVKTDSQLFWDEQEKDMYDGIYHHPNVIRQNLTPIYGKKLEKTGGEYAQSFEVDVNEYWNAAQMGVIAFLNRGIENGLLNHQVINSCEQKLAVPAGIECAPSLETGEETIIAIYDVTGTQVSDFSQKGIFIVKAMKNGKPVVRKVFVK